MNVTLPKELEGKLAQLACIQGRDSASLVVEAVERLIDYDSWFVAQVDRGLKQIEASQTLSHDEVGARIGQYLSTKSSAA